MVEAKTLRNLKALKLGTAGERVTFRARVLRCWEVGGLRMCLVGDESALMRVEVGEALVEQSKSYEFRDALVRESPAKRRLGGWHSVSLVEDSEIVRLSEDVPIAQDEAYLERTYKILAGVQRKKARREGRIEPWQHPANFQE